MRGTRRCSRTLGGAISAALMWIAVPWGAAIAQTTFTTSTFTIMSFYTAWDNDWVLVQPDLPVENPHSCSTPDLYSTQKPPSVASPGLQLRNSVLLSAFLTDRPVRLVLDGCGGTGRPSIKAIVVAPQ